MDIRREAVDGTPVPALSLDIGTRGVVGVLTVPDRRGLRIVATEKLEHRARSMYDGQIHDVAAVAEVVSQVRNRLEQRCGMPLREAAAAAAGRALRTQRGRARQELARGHTLTAEEVFALELTAVQAAQRELGEDLHRRQRPGHEYHYVGHTVVSASVDGVGISHLAGQPGEVAELEVIATFLPRGVVDALVAVLERVGLELTTLTLEPIAAMEAAVPVSMRHLRLALVDVGAGTADIAVTDHGAIVGYDMVPMAGDEITEALSEACLLDFHTAEQMKRRLLVTDSCRFTNILGHPVQVRTADLVVALRPAVAALAEAIAGRIMALTGAAPGAVMLVGGGSQTPGLPESLAEALGLPPARVGVRGRVAIAGVTGARRNLRGPEGATPVGIALTACKDPVGFAYVYVNRSGVRLFNPTRLTVADALLAAGIDVAGLQARPGPGLTVWVNGAMRLVPGLPGEPGIVTLGGRTVDLEHPVRHRDRLQVRPGVRGRKGTARVRDLLPAPTVDVEAAGVEPGQTLQLTVNGQAAALDDEVTDNDRIEYRYEPVAPAPTAFPATPRPHQAEDDHIRVAVNGSWCELKATAGGGGTLTATDSAPALVAHLLPHVPLATAPPRGKTRLSMVVNGVPAGFTTPIQDGDRVEIGWED